MAKFCGSCGSPLNEGKRFCGKCGAPASSEGQPSSSPSQPAYTPVVQPQVPVTPAAVPIAPATASTGSSALLKVAIAAVVIIFVGGVAALGAVYYVVHKVKEKVAAVRHEVEGDNPSSAHGELASMIQKAASSTSSGDDNSTGFKGDPCRFLSKEEVTKAVGIEIIRTEGQDSGCGYIAKGDPADMVSKHMTAMVTSQGKSNGSTPSAEQTKMMQQITGAFFKQQEASDKSLSKEAATGEVIILSLNFSAGNADLEMKMNRMAFNHIAGSNGDGKTTDQRATGDLDGIGDEAYEVGGTSLIFRKGQTVVHMMFPECPCDANAIKPLAANIASKL
jgi:hypothetical protein